MPRSIIKISLLVLCITTVQGSIVWGQSDFDFFFKNNSQYQDVVVKEVLSTDTIILQEKTGDKPEIVKLIGLRAPDVPRTKATDIDRDQFGFTVKQPVNPATPLEEKALEYVKELLKGKHVRLEFDSEKQSSKFQTIAYIFLLEGNVFVNQEILRQGFAHLSIRPPNMKYAKELRTAYQEARNEQRGLQGAY